jgi:hypothetical protein
VTDLAASDFAKVMAAAFTSGAPGTEVTAPDGSVMKVEASDDPGVERVMRGDSEDGPWQMRLYKALPAAPAGYPEYPFLANECFCLMEFASQKAMLVWWGRGGADKIGQEMIQQSENTGWSPAEKDDQVTQAHEQLGFMAGGVEEHRFRKDGRVRSIVNGTFGPIAYASMIERSAEGQTDSDPGSAGPAPN